MSKLKEAQYKFAEKLNELICWLVNNGYKVRYGDVLRSTDPLKCPSCGNAHSYQDLLFYNKRSKVKASKHNDRLAADLIIERDYKTIPDAEWLEIGAKWEEMGGEWGGYWNQDPKDLSKPGFDRFHFQWENYLK